MHGRRHIVEQALYVIKVFMLTLALAFLITANCTQPGIRTINNAFYRTAELFRLRLVPKSV